jgi:hypothetical protein
MHGFGKSCLPRSLGIVPCPYSFFDGSAKWKIDIKIQSYTMKFMRALPMRGGVPRADPDNKSISVRKLQDKIKARYLSNVKELFLSFF